MTNNVCILKDISSDEDLKDDTHQHIAVVGQDRVVVLIEEEVVIESKNIADAFIMFFAFHYILDLQYHHAMKTTMEFFQKAILKLGAESIPPKIRSIMEKIAKLKSD